jgi:tetratricopeptide (TPR) repeat protein
VLWARAQSVEALTSSFAEIAHLLDLLEKDAQEQAIITQAVKRWLQRQRGWLLILDNADSPALLLDFLPPTVGGHLLITTRAADASAHIAGLAHPLVVETFSGEQGALFLLHRSDLLALDATLAQAETHTRQLALDIAHELGGLPLALDQAGAYLKATGSSLTTYQQIYQQRRGQLLKERRGADHPEPVATTWNISFRNVEQQNPAAADLLRLCAFLAPDAIPEVILTKGAEALGLALAPLAAEAYKLNEAIEALCAYSLITRDPHKQILTVHRLVQAVLRDTMKEQEQLRWITFIIDAVDALFPWPTFEVWERCTQYLPHVLTCVEWIMQRDLLLLNGATLCDKAGLYLSEHALYIEAEMLYQRAVRIWEQSLGPDHPHVASSLNGLARLYYLQGKYEQAEPLYHRVMRIWEQSLGSDQPDLTYPLNGLAKIYSEQGKCEEAEPPYHHVMRIWEQSLGSDYPNMIGLLYELAKIYSEQGKYEKAESLYQRAVRITEQSLGPAHSQVAFSLNLLALFYEEQGKYEQAEPLYQRAMRITEQSLGPAHPDLTYHLYGLAEIYSEQGKHEEAKPLYHRVVWIWEQSLEPDHSLMASSLYKLALLYEERGKYEEAELLYQRAVRTWEQSLGPDHPDVAYPLNNLAILYSAQGKYEEAEPLYHRVMRITEQGLGPDHPLTQEVREGYVILLHMMKRKEK